MRFWPLHPGFRARALFSAAALAAAATAAPATACDAYSCDGVGWQSYRPGEPGVMTAFVRAREAGTTEALEAFVRDYPGSPAASEALRLLERGAGAARSGSARSAAPRQAD